MHSALKRFLELRAVFFFFLNGNNLLNGNFKFESLEKNKFSYNYAVDKSEMLLSTLKTKFACNFWYILVDIFLVNEAGFFYIGVSTIVLYERKI